ncbi:MAG: hypothetical protein GY696_18440 [Gammaproteobacteria bacterium]|nr:hypothetical protein [Gammaproteobacteria bacterium]
MVEAAVGDSLELHFGILDPENSPYEIFVRELIAKDGNDQNEIMLLDSDGCPTESRILGPLVREEGVVKSLVAKFDAFKFPTSEVVQFRALVTPCMPSCEPVKCVYNDYSIGKQTNVDSYGRRRRRDMSFAENPLTKWLANAERSRKVRSVQGGVVGKDMLVTHAFTITDKFAKKDNKNVANKKSASAVPHVNNDIAADININDMHQTISNEIARERYFNSANNVAFATSNQPKSDSFGPTVLQEESFEVCLNLTGVVVGVGVFVVTQIASVLAWTHFWHTRQKKMKRSQFRS